MPPYKINLTAKTMNIRWYSRNTVLRKFDFLGLSQHNAGVSEQTKNLINVYKKKSGWIKTQAFSILKVTSQLFHAVALRRKN